MDRRSIQISHRSSLPSKQPPSLRLLRISKISRRQSTCSTRWPKYLPRRNLSSTSLHSFRKKIKYKNRNLNYRKQSSNPNKRCHCWARPLLVHHRISSPSSATIQHFSRRCSFRLGLKTWKAHQVIRLRRAFKPSRINPLRISGNLFQIIWLNRNK